MSQVQSRTVFEMFGNRTEQPASSRPNGFLALAVFDGNRDQWIDAADDVYKRLRLWTDVNHDGISQAAELKRLNEGGILRISLDVRESGRRDGRGNRYTFRARIVSERPQDAGPFAYDVFLTVSRSDSSELLPIGLVASQGLMVLAVAILVLPRRRPNNGSRKRMPASGADQ
jgi:hypothetical protein